METKRTYTAWKASEVEYLRNNYGRLSSGQIAMKLGVDINRVYAAIRRHKVQKIR